MLSRKTQKQLLQDLVARSAAAPDHRQTSSSVVPVLLLAVLAAYVFTQI